MRADAGRLKPAPTYESLRAYANVRRGRLQPAYDDATMKAWTFFPRSTLNNGTL